VASAEHGVSGSERAGISVKLSALHPRYEPQRARLVLDELLPRVLQLTLQAAEAGVPMTLDAEEADRLELQLAVVRAVMVDPRLAAWDGFGLALQAYQRRAPVALDWLIALARSTRRRLNIRLVKGAYWDTEIKRAQERGLDSYPVYTRKCNTDVAWLACARQLMASDPALVYPQFATHNAHSVAYVLALAGNSRRPFEFQRLHGMGRDLYDQLVTGGEGPGGRAPRAACRVYAPVGSHAELLPYLVRRLLENGANTSFVHRLADDRLPVAELARDPVAEADQLERVSHPAIPDPPEMFGAVRRNSSGINFADSAAYAALLAAAGSPLPAGHPSAAEAEPDCMEPSAALQAAAASYPAWESTPVAERAACLRRAADLFESRRLELMDLAVHEAGKTWPNALAEVREAVDFLRYYAVRAEVEFSAARPLPGPTGESNELWLRGRGPFVCISPWNFPLAIFTGQVAAALAAGNSVIAKPAEQTPRIAARAVQLLREAGVPRSVLSFVPGDGAAVGRLLLSDPRVAGVAFTGSVEVAQLINRQLAARDGPIAALIAETGGQNVMFVDSSALPEQVVLDVAQSAFDSAGQRCSAARVLLLQEEIAERTVGLLRGYMDTLLVGDPALPETDIGPVIDAEARARLEAHIARLAPHALWVHRAPMSPGMTDVTARRAVQGQFFAPAALEIESLDLLQGEVFGPVLHVVRYRSADLGAMVEKVNNLGFGLTLGVQTRIDATARRIAEATRVGNVYVNRNMIGAVVGVQPFGGCGLSGTGPKAGGPHYLHRFATERTITTNTAAVGGNASLLSLDKSP
jgi:RHH-type proline utilization regulon transcriptional repressor/proline dehydrogenase/delta 1-pyrroline-5-carboxylate dehydrogenase